MKNEFKQSKRVESLKNINSGDYFKGIVKIVRKTQPGPVILNVSDGYSSMEAVSKECPFNQDEIVELEGKVEKRAGKLQIEINQIYTSEIDFDTIVDKNSNPEKKELSIKSDKLTKLQPHLTRIAKRIRKAILLNQPILIRHHADADGIMSGMAIEQACKLLIKEINLNPAHLLYRSPSKAPFYEIKDVLRDVGFTKRYLEGHGQGKPLILVLDNGSTPEDVLAMKTLKTLDFDVIVVDHHNPVDYEGDKTSVCPYILDHLNPYMYGFDGQITAGMLCYEIARLIYKDFEAKEFPAISSIGDRSKIPEAEEYIKNSGKTIEQLRKVVIAIDFLAYQFRFDSGEGVYEDLFKKQGFVDIINEEVNKGVETQLQSTLPYLRTQEINGVTFSHIDLEKYTLRFTYPTPGKVIGMIHDEVAIGKETIPVISIGYLSDMIILRATKPVLPIDKIIKKLQKDLPEANVDGGGHECAGTIKFVSAHLTPILENIKHQIRDLKLLEEE
jgi:archaea-specific RecJ-like exonuclease